MGPDDIFGKKSCSTETPVHNPQGPKRSIDNISVPETLFWEHKQDFLITKGSHNAILDQCISFIQIFNITNTLSVFFLTQFFLCWTSDPQGNQAPSLQSGVQLHHAGSVHGDSGGCRLRSLPWQIPGAAVQPYHLLSQSAARYIQLQDIRKENHLVLISYMQP